MQQISLLANDPAAQVRARLTLLNLRSESIHRHLNKHASALPALRIVIDSLRRYNKHHRNIGWNYTYYETMRNNLRVLQTQLANSHLREPAFHGTYRPALQQIETCENLAAELLDILHRHPELTAPPTPDQPEVPVLQAFPPPPGANANG